MSGQGAAEAAFWGMGRYRQADGGFGHVSLTEAEFDREVDAAATRLAAWGVGRDSLVLVIAGVAEAAQFAPYQRAARRLGGMTMTAEPSPFDARRVAAMLERFRIDLVIGLDSQVLAGLEQSGEVEALSRCPNLVVRPDAYARAAELGLNPAALCLAGPALAIECPCRAGPHLCVQAWSVETEGGRIVLSPAPGRDPRLPGVVTDIEGEVVRGACACGSDDPRILVRSSAGRP